MEDVTEQQLQFPVAYVPEKRFMIETMCSLQHKVEAFVEREDQISKAKQLSQKLMVAKDRARLASDQYSKSFFDSFKANNVSDKLDDQIARKTTARELCDYSKPALTRREQIKQIIAFKQETQRNLQLQDQLRPKVVYQQQVIEDDKMKTLETQIAEKRKVLNLVRGVKKTQRDAMGEKADLLTEYRNQYR